MRFQTLQLNLVGMAKKNADEFFIEDEKSLEKVSF